MDGERENSASEPPDEGGPVRRFFSLRGALFFLLLLASLSSVTFGVIANTRFEDTPGDAGAAPIRWPGSTHLTRSGQGDLLVFLHPLCPCSAATLDELAQLDPMPAVTILFADDARLPEDGRSATLRAQARSIPGAKVISDSGGAEARRFGARTSGYVLFYDAAGAMTFHGGVTPSRGHEGANEGFDNLQASLLTGKAAPEGARVFGCALFSN